MGKYLLENFDSEKRWVPFIDLIVKKRPLTGTRSYAGFANFWSNRSVIINVTASKTRVGQHGPKRIKVTDGCVLLFDAWKLNLSKLMLSTRTNQSKQQIFDVSRKHQSKNHFKWLACSRKGGTKAVHVGGLFSSGAFRCIYTLRSLGRATHAPLVR